MGLPAEKLEERKRFIGGSEAAAICGLSKWKTPARVWAEKLGYIEPGQEEKLHLEVGNLLEDDVAELFVRKTGKQIETVNETLFHPQYPFIGANIDRRVLGEGTILECKTTNSFKRKEFEGEELPPEHLLQVYHYMAVTGAPKAYVAVLIGNQDFKISVVNRDETAINHLIKREVDFWQNYVLKNKMPVLTKNDNDTLLALYPQAKPLSSISLTDNENQLLEMLEALEKDRDNVDGQIEKIKNELKEKLGEHEEGLTSLWRMTWKNQSRCSLDVKRLKVEQPDIWAKYAKTTSTRVFKYDERKD